ncbi:bifunctional UDP-N-acetylglucosamine diphosphorylase/glucosamine-1-phosphate N-acetyltransferase GlmU [Nitrosomonas cryotolerans]|uniref:bifunctional UDP-N-acetylglucosamine diphosphorylase/glucosamine-1-phosphate N-acetyltransferase GlmU n=1 Tax=Nitrosomonas cryotolerans TaxID=44575 RepID=UPI00048C9976|nr:bifunctional UDP-N-acetylglucosamine diphosphorylase/glucosamine-1-phosphate N-acetyltransferase GlmU [Nitrosomonas cryotolerans]
MPKLNIVILAAGGGKRMQSSLPKVLHHLAGKPLLAHVLDAAHALSPSQICIVYGHGGEAVPLAIADEKLLWVKQESQLGTGHALLQALPYLDEEGSTLVLFGDVPLVSVDTLNKLVRVSEERYCALLTAELETPTGYGRIVRVHETNEISAIVEEKDASEAQREICEINTGVMVVPNRFLREWLPKLENNNVQREFYLTDIVAMAVKKNIRVAASRSTHLWEVMGVNNQQQLAALERIYQNEYANKLLADGVTLADPSRIDVRGLLTCGRGVEIDINCIFEGHVQLGDYVKIKAHSILKNVTIETGTIIYPFSLLEETEIGENCRVGPYARIRPGTRLSSQVHIGNFVEIKNSRIADGSKANHLSYIGDAVIGEKVNIGAGTITCNYDGAYKHQTIIEDDVFIGSDTQLIAPVRITKGSTVGAGSTITRDTPQNKLSLSRTKQISIPGWKRPIKTQT